MHALLRPYELCSNVLWYHMDRYAYGVWTQLFLILLDRIRAAV